MKSFVFVWFLFGLPLFSQGSLKSAKSKAIEMSEFDLPIYQQTLHLLENEKLAVHWLKTTALPISSKCVLSPVLEDSIEKDLLRPPRLSNLSIKNRLKLSVVGEKILNRFWLLRLRWQNDFRKLLSRDPNFSDLCAKRIHAYFMYLRYSEESLLLFLVELKILSKNRGSLFSSGAPYTLMEPGTTFQFQPGDVILSYSRDVTSPYASLAVLPARSLSHISLVAKRDGEIVVIDFYPPGAIETHLARWLNFDQTRLAVYRPVDRQLAERAAEIASNRISDYFKKNGKPLPFKFSVNSGSSSLLCSGFVASVFEEASANKILVPKFKSFIHALENSDLLKRLGVENPLVFHPSDIEIDPRFNLVAESRQYAALSKAHRQFAIYNLLWDRIARRTYVYQYSWKTWAKTYYAKALAWCCNYGGSPNANDASPDAVQSIVEIIQQAELIDSKLTDKILREPLIPKYPSFKEYQQILNSI
jgi:hypothetical protein